ncbi:nucleoside recognition GATE domain-containing membrane protein YjiH [Moraxella cuniculi DSM 21768]|uniref:Nucleoside recognition GATE domain-containing membrane protein YjiH n=1 Tax=Moraxella cuniculi DSM 21768 TaxID=1122245 RepID=A0A1N7D666_9GAMM|nr:YjiH family protein [Moraxella cuniculi]OOS07850.1 histidine transporter [Moraxella cuniculi]SIR71257.1 nucleoside recognition GATE domain-containing membrane protein YjiH [Moraxella cuniculi DSM 21768]
MTQHNKSTQLALWQMIVFSLVGIVMFFVPFTIGNKRTIAFDHAASYLVNEQKPLAIVLLFALMIYGVAKPFVTGSYKHNLTNKILTALKVAGLILAVLYITGLAPELIMQKDMMPFLFDKLALPVGMIVPIGAMMLAFLLGFGLLELMGVLMQPVMRPIWKTPGASAIDAVASFVGSYSVALLITNRVYLQGQYSTKEAVIIATGFSTVSTAFMVIIAKTLNLMDFWNLYFWSCLVITFLVTAITARLPPIATMDNSKPIADVTAQGQSRLKLAFDTGINTAKASDGLLKVLWTNLKDGIEMAAAIVPSIIAIGLLGLLFAKYTPVFDVLGMALYPFTYLGGLPQPMVVAKGLSAGLAEVFLPALLLADSDILTRFVTAIVPVSSIIFFSAMIPCVLATNIPLSVPKMILIWFIRTALSIVLACAFAQLALALGWLA